MCGRLIRNMNNINTGLRDKGAMHCQCAACFSPHHFAGQWPGTAVYVSFYDCNATQCGLPYCSANFILFHTQCKLRYSFLQSICTMQASILITAFHTMQTSMLITVFHNYTQCKLPCSLLHSIRNPSFQCKLPYCNVGSILQFWFHTAMSVPYCNVILQCDTTMQASIQAFILQCKLSYCIPYYSASFRTAFHKLHTAFHTDYNASFRTGFICGTTMQASLLQCRLPYCHTNS